MGVCLVHYERLQGERSTTLRISVVDPVFHVKLPFRGAYREKAARLEFGSKSLTIYDLAARPFGNWYYSLTVPLTYMLLSPPSFPVRLDCALTTLVPVVLDQSSKVGANTAAHSEVRRSIH